MIVKKLVEEEMGNQWKLRQENAGEVGRDWWRLRKVIVALSCTFFIAPILKSFEEVGRAWT